MGSDAQKRVVHTKYTHGDVSLEVSELDGRVLRFCYLSCNGQYMTVPVHELDGLLKCMQDADADGYVGE